MLKLYTFRNFIKMTGRKKNKFETLRESYEVTKNSEIDHKAETVVMNPP